MIDALKEWLLAVISAAVCLAVLDALIPKGAIRGIAKVSGGLVMFLVMVQPWQQLDPTDWEMKYETYQQQIDDQVGQYRETYREQMEVIIEEETGAYISEKAESMGVMCRAEVETALEDGVPIPASVRLDAARDEVLALWIEQELGIAEAQQYWGVAP